MVQTRTGRTVERDQMIQEDYSGLAGGSQGLADRAAGDLDGSRNPGGDLRSRGVEAIGGDPENSGQTVNIRRPYPGQDNNVLAQVCGNPVYDATASMKTFMDQLLAGQQEMIRCQTHFAQEFAVIKAQQQTNDRWKRGMEQRTNMQESQMAVLMEQVQDLKNELRQVGIGSNSTVGSGLDCPGSNAVHVTADIGASVQPGVSVDIDTPCADVIVENNRLGTHPGFSPSSGRGLHSAKKKLLLKKQNARNKAAAYRKNLRDDKRSLKIISTQDTLNENQLNLRMAVTLIQEAFKNISEEFPFREIEDCRRDGKGNFYLQFYARAWDKVSQLLGYSEENFKEYPLQVDILGKLLVVRNMPSKYAQYVQFVLSPIPEHYNLDSLAEELEISNTQALGVEMGNDTELFKDPRRLTRRSIDHMGRTSWIPSLSVGFWAHVSIAGNLKESQSLMFEYNMKSVLEFEQNKIFCANCQKWGSHSPKSCRNIPVCSQCKGTHRVEECPGGDRLDSKRSTVENIEVPVEGNKKVKRRETVEMDDNMVENIQTITQQELGGL